MTKEKAIFIKGVFVSIILFVSHLARLFWKPTIVKILEKSTVN